MSAEAVGDFVGGAIAWACFNRFHGAANFFDGRKKRNGGCQMRAVFELLQVQSEVVLNH